MSDSIEEVSIGDSHSEKVRPINADDELLASMGYQQELKRDFGLFELFLICFSNMSITPSVASVLVDQIPAGAVGFTWGWFVPCFFIFSLSITLSEFASSMPTAAGMYWWTYVFAPERGQWKSYLSFLCGYSDSLGLIAGVGSINYGAAKQLLGSVNVANGYVASDGVTFGVFCALCLIQCGILTLPNRFMTYIQYVSLVLNVSTIVILCIALPVGLKHNHLPINSGQFVFGNTTNNTNYPYGMSYMMSWMAAIWSVSNQDGSIHMAEEASNASTAVPFALLSSIGACWIFGFLFLCILAAVVDPTDQGFLSLLTQPAPIASIIERALNRRWSIAIMSIFAVMQFIMGLGVLFTTSRQIYAFARDGALPLSRWAKVTTRNLPLAAMAYTAIVAMLISLLILAGPAAAQAIFSLAMSALYVAWCLPIWLYTFSSRRIERPGPFYLGHFWSKANALVASLYGIYVVGCLSMMPANIPVTNASEMNYSCVVCGAVWIGCSLYWLFDAKKWFHGPKANIDSGEVSAEVIEALSVNDSSRASLKTKKE